MINSVHKKALLIRPGAKGGVPPILGWASTPTRAPTRVPAQGTRPAPPEHPEPPPEQSTSRPSRSRKPRFWVGILGDEFCS